LRSTAQLISYELILSSVLLVLVFLSGTFNLSVIIEIQKSIYFFLLVPTLYLIFYIAAVAETNRAPFDLAEAESELVSGFMTEHAAGIFVFFFLAEYASIILICVLISIVFLGGYDILSFYDKVFEFIYPIIDILYEILTIHNNDVLTMTDSTFISNNVLSIMYPLNLSTKSSALVFLFILIRASFPRLRFDNLMSCC
jgi:NADH-ubiquinone oxidoreductase chain 1